ncbi:metal-dependent hydrolase [Alkaliphilus pronyensis]|uniref:Metal-dependent hydrolase n=1 Tax=Alkaliphilus pronyensis TaxID=1482732 RepID=A0A6I0F727_9FIRM|nr:metal-dependent hydrolase [Alkaliphilus pronyensis]KAB3533853.1 metal-dependent hydrolase [Alkaliphilus pronyensis]
MIIFKGITHILISIALYAAITEKISINRPILPLILIIALGSIIADIDHPKSLIGRFFIIGGLIFGGHRGVTHSLIAAGLFSIPVALYDPLYAIVFFISYLIHLVADTTTITGVKWLYPFNSKSYSLKLARTGAEELFVFGICLLYLWNKY